MKNLTIRKSTITKLNTNTELLNGRTLSWGTRSNGRTLSWGTRSN